jgi:hypothetical protein
MVLYVIFIALSFKTIFTGNYADPSQQVFSVTLQGGIQALFCGVLLYDLYRRVLQGEMTPRRAFLTYFAIFCVTDFIKGITGLATGAVMVAAFVLFDLERSRARRLFTLAVAALSIVFLTSMVRAVRSAISAQGREVVSTFLDTFFVEEQEIVRTGEGIERKANGAQYAAHVLECVALYEQGVSREWRSVYRPLEYTFKPTVFVQLFGLERSREAAWELGDYYHHGGGIYVLGELYWNGGYLCVFVVMVFFASLASLCDRRFRTSPGWLIMACCFGPPMLQGFGYGVAQMMRGLINGCLVLGAYQLLRNPLARMNQRTAGGSPNPSLMRT